MSWPAAVSADRIRSTVLAVLAEADDSTPADGALFCQIIAAPEGRLA